MALETMIVTKIHDKPLVMNAMYITSDYIDITDGETHPLAVALHCSYERFYFKMGFNLY